MNQGRFIHQINEHKPFNINIEFNINGKRHEEPSECKEKRLHIANEQPMQSLCQCKPPRTPDIAQTDRNIYNKELDYLQPMEDPRQKRKSKRNSMDINIISKTANQQSFQKSKIKGLNQTQLFKKGESVKKRSFSKYQAEGFKKSLWEGASKSAAIEIKSSRKGQINHSLKSIIHKIVNSELSKRTLGSSFSKGKSPYQLHNQSVGGSTNRKKQKKKNVGSKSDKDIKGEQIVRQNAVVQKLNSLKSMSASIVRSEMEEPEIPYYSKKRGTIHIHTDPSIDFIEEIAFYEKKVRREDRRKEIVNPVVLQDTNDLIETYIQMMRLNGNSENREQSQENVEQQNEINQVQFEQNEKAGEKSKQRKNIREALSKQMEHLFSSDKIQESESKQQNSSLVIKDEKNEEASKRDKDISGEKMRPFLSSQIERGGLSQQLERIKLQELKKQQIQKWGYLLQFIKKNMSSEEADTQAVLNQVYSFLQRSKNDLQLDIDHSTSKKPATKEQYDEEFTVKYSENREEDHKDYYQDSPIEKEEKEDQDVASFREDYITEENEDLKLLNLQTISGALKHRKETLLAKKEKQLNALEMRRDASRLTEKQYERERDNILKWTNKELQEISKAKKSIWQGYRQARGILDKNIYSRQYEQQTVSGKMMKCLSQTYLRRAGITFTKNLQAQQEEKQKEKLSSQKSKSQQEVSKSQEQSLDYMNKQSEQSEGEDKDDLNQDDHEESVGSPLIQPLEGSKQLSIQKSQEMEAIKERLMRMKNEHFTGQDSSDNISYQQVQKQLEQDYSDEEMAIINKQVGSQKSGYNKLQTKLKYCCAEDKEDIFQFIFLDLCIQLYQEPCNDNRIMKSINRFVTRAQSQAKKKKGVKTNLNVVKEYLKRFSSFLVRTNKAALNNLNNPMGPSALEMLRYMHDGDYDIRQEEEEAPTFIVPVTAFQKFQQSLIPTLEFETYYDDPDKEEARIGFLKTILHIHNRALFDSLNEFLDQERPFGIWGTPFPWKKAAAFPHAFTDAQLQAKLQKSSDKVIEHCSYVCGLLADKEQSLVGNVKISEAYVEQIRQDRLSRMLANELVQSQQRWLFYDDQQTEVLVELGNHVWTCILAEVRGELIGLR